jgi:hypothetical protein
MKELEKKETDKIENVKQVSIENQTVFLGTARPKQGHTMFEFNFKLNTIVEAQFDELPALKFTDAASGQKSSSKKITKKPDCIYVSALNKKNALKILKRDLNIDIRFVKI